MWHLKNEKNASHFDWSDFVPTLRKVACAAPHNTFHCRAGMWSVDEGLGLQGWPGLCPLTSLLGTFLSWLQSRGEERWHLSSYVPGSAGTDADIISCVVHSNDKVGTQGQEHVARSLVGTCRREGRHQACSFFMKFGFCFVYNIFGSLWRKGVTLPAMA